MAAELLIGDCLAVMAGMEPESVDAIVTDPPYGLEFMGKDWDHGIPGEPFWREAIRVAKPGAHLLAFGGTRTFHRLTCAIEDAGWEIRDCVCWLYGSGFPKSHNLDGEWKGWGTALKPAWEPVIVARKPLVGTVAANVQKYGTGAMNVDGCRVEFSGEGDKNAAKPQGRATTKASGAAAATPDAGRGIERIEFPIKQSDLGRWPANVCHDGSEEVVERFPQADGCQSASRPSGGDCHNAMFAPGEAPLREWYADSGSAARFFYCAKASRSEREAGMTTVREAGMTTVREAGGAQHTIGVKLARNHHPTVKPVALMRWLCRLVTPPNGLVLDPFMGSGSTGIAALREGFRFIGIEQDAAYLEIARQRISNDAPLLREA